MLTGEIDLGTLQQDAAGVWIAENPASGVMEPLRWIQALADTKPDEAAYWISYYGFAPDGRGVKNITDSQAAAIKRQVLDASRLPVSEPILLYQDMWYRAFNPRSGQIERVYYVQHENSALFNPESGPSDDAITYTYYYESERPRFSLPYTFQDDYRQTGLEFAVKAGLAALASMAVGAVAGSIFGTAAEGAVTTGEMAAMESGAISVADAGTLTVADAGAAGVGVGDAGATYGSFDYGGFDASAATPQVDPGLTLPDAQTPSMWDTLKPYAQKLVPLATKLLQQQGGAASPPTPQSRAAMPSQGAALTAEEKNAMLIGGGILAAAALAFAFPMKPRARKRR